MSSSLLPPPPSSPSVSASLLPPSTTILMDHHPLLGGSISNGTTTASSFTTISTPSNVSAEFSALKSELLSRENELRQLRIQEQQKQHHHSHSHRTPLSGNRPRRQAASVAISRVKTLTEELHASPTGEDGEEEEEAIVGVEDDEDDEDFVESEESSLEYKPRKSHRAASRESDEEEDLDDYSDMERIDEDDEEDEEESEDLDYDDDEDDYKKPRKSSAAKKQRKPYTRRASAPFDSSPVAQAPPMLDENGQPIIKRGRGRPRKNPNEPPKPKKQPRAPAAERAPKEKGNRRLDGKACALLTTGACGVVDQSATGRVNIRMDADGEVVSSGANRVYVFKEWKSDKDAIDQIIEATKYVPQLSDLADGTRVCVISDQEQTAVVDGDEMNDPKSPTKAMVRIKYDVSRVTANIPLENLRLIPANHRALGPLPKKGAGRPTKADLEERAQTRIAKFVEPPSKDQAWRDSLVAPLGGPRKQFGSSFAPSPSKYEDNNNNSSLKRAREVDDDEEEETSSPAAKRVRENDDDEQQQQEIPTPSEEFEGGGQRAAIQRLAGRQAAATIKSRYQEYDDEEDDDE